MEEIWKPIPGYAGYEASNLGQIRSYHQIGRSSFSSVPHILKPATDKNGYRGVGLGKGIFKRVHYLVGFCWASARGDEGVT